MRAVWVAIDGGQSTTRARASWTDADIETVGFVHTSDGARIITQQVAELLSALPPAPAPVQRLVVGHTGLPVDGRARDSLAADLVAAGLAREVFVAPDEVVAHAGAFAGRPGVVNAVGTGTVTLGVDGAGTGRRVDGWGYLFGDAGSAFSIGRAALDAGLRSADGRGPATALEELAAVEFGAHLRDATWDLYADARRIDRVARFAPTVIATAPRDGVAARIVEDAAREIVRSCAAALHALDGVDEVAVVGRLVAPGSALDVALRRELAERTPEARLVTPLGGPLDGAAWIAHSGPSLYRQLVYRRERSE
ncbi:ATPase [Microbacterium lushaniae]|nr:ATPase [Microbacterium lushaniae]KAA9157393.1 ATPase [Microbacterium lushaniae]